MIHEYRLVAKVSAPHDRYELHVGTDVVTIEVTAEATDFLRVPADQPHATATADGQMLRAVCFGHRSVQTGDLRIDGDPNAARRVTRLLRTPIDVDSRHGAAHRDLAQFRHLARGRHGR